MDGSSLSFFFSGFFLFDQVFSPVEHLIFEVRIENPSSIDGWMDDGWMK